MELPNHLASALAKAEAEIEKKAVIPCRLALTPVLEYLAEKGEEPSPRIQKLYAKILETELEEAQSKKQRIKI